MWLRRRRLPRIEGTQQLEELDAAVDIIRDRWTVPPIYAQTEHDFYFAQGFVHAQDRLWQMTFNRRLVAGRLAEVLGSRAVQIDRWIRALGLRWVAEQETGQLAALQRAVLTAYAAGVNVFLVSSRRYGQLPIEFTLLRYRPKPWKPSTRSPGPR